MKKPINENTYLHGKGKIFNLRHLNEFLVLVPTIIPTALLCVVNIGLLLDKLPQKIILYFIMELK
jgi:hypothetical protein